MSIQEKLIFSPEGALEQQRLNEKLSFALLRFYQEAFWDRKSNLIEYLRSSENADYKVIHSDFYGINNYKSVRKIGEYIDWRLEDWEPIHVDTGIYGFNDILGVNKPTGTICFLNCGWEVQKPLATLAKDYKENPYNYYYNDKVPELFVTYLNDPTPEKHSTGFHINRAHTSVPVWVSENVLDAETKNQLQALRQAKAEQQKEQNQEEKTQTASLSSAPTLTSNPSNKLGKYSGKTKPRVRNRGVNSFTSEEASLSPRPAFVHIKELWEVREKQLQEHPEFREDEEVEEVRKMIANDYKELLREEALYEQMQDLADIFTNYLRTLTNFKEVVGFGLVKYAQELQVNAPDKLADMSNILGIDLVKLAGLDIDLQELYPTFIQGKNDAHQKALQAYEINKATKLANQLTNALNQVWQVIDGNLPTKSVSLTNQYINARLAISEFEIDFGFAIPNPKASGRSAHWINRQNPIDSLNTGLEGITTKQQLNDVNSQTSKKAKRELTSEVTSKAKYDVTAEINLEELSFAEIWELPLQPGMVVNFAIGQEFVRAGREILIEDTLCLRKDFTCGMPTKLENLNKFLWDKDDKNGVNSLKSEKLLNIMLNNIF